MQLVAIQPSLLKFKPVDSKTLSSAEKIAVPPGSRYEIIKFEPERNNHALVQLKQPIGAKTTFFVFAPHFNLEKSPGVLERLFKPKSKVADYIAQPTGFTCQSACCGMVIGDSNIMGIRADLEAIGEPGDPSVMGVWLKPRVAEYSFNDNASLNDLIATIEQGKVAIIHGYFTGAGHVVLVNSWKQDRKVFIMDDPWAEFNAGRWAYDFNKSGDDVEYSAKLIYATCVASYSFDHALALYKSAKPVYDQPGMWLHSIRN